MHTAGNKLVPPIVQIINDSVVCSDSSNQPGTRLRTNVAGMMLLAGLLLIACQAGCQSTGTSAHPGPTTFDSRFAPMSVGSVGGEPASVGLAVQCSDDPILLQFSERLAVLLTKELELSTPGIRTVAWRPAPLLVPAIPDLNQAKEERVITVSFQEPQPNMPLESPVFTDIVDPAEFDLHKCLQVRIVDFRPWYPMSAVARLTIIDGVTLQTVAATTVSWSANDGKPGHTTSNGTTCQSSGQLSANTFVDFGCQDLTCDPGASHNSPEAFSRFIATEIAAWFAIQQQPAAVPIPN